MGDPPPNTTVGALTQVSPLLRRGLLNPLTTALPVLLRDSGATWEEKGQGRPPPAPHLWCALPLMNERAGACAYVLYRPALADGDDLYAMACEQFLWIEVLESGFLGPSVTRHTPAAFLELAPWAEEQLWRLLPMPAHAPVAEDGWMLTSLRGSVVYNGTLVTGERRLLFDCPLAFGLSPVTVSRIRSCDSLLEPVANPAALALLRLVHQHVIMLEQGVALATVERRDYEAAVLTSFLVGALDASLGRPHPLTPHRRSAPAHLPLLLGWVERDNAEQECKETRMAASYQEELEEERLHGPANTFIVAWLGPDRQHSILTCCSLADILVWLQHSTTAVFPILAAEWARYALMPAAGDFSEFFATQSDLTAVYRAGFLQEVFWVLKAVVAEASTEYSGSVLGSGLVVQSLSARHICESIETHGEWMTGTLIPLLRRLQGRFVDGALDRGDRDFAWIGLQWAAAWAGHFTAYRSLWRGMSSGTEAKLLAAFRRARIEERLANLQGLIRLYDAETVTRRLDDCPEGEGPAFRILTTSLLHAMYYQPYVHTIPIPVDPASPFYTPMTTQRWYQERDAEVLEVPVSPDLLATDTELERFPPPAPYGTTKGEGPVLEWQTVPYSARRGWTGAFDAFRRQALANRLLAFETSFLRGSDTHAVLRRAAASIVEQGRSYGTEDGLNDWRRACVLSTWIYRCYPTLRSLLEMQFGFVFQPLVSETHLTGCRPIDIGAPENFFTISQVSTMQWAVLPRYNYATSASHIHILFQGTQGFMDLVRDLTALSGTLHVIQGSTGFSVAVVNEWFVPLLVELLSIKQALRTAARYLHMVHSLRGKGTPDIMMNLTGHSLGGAYATILAWMYLLGAPEFSPTELAELGIRDFRVVTFGQPPLVSRPSLDFLKGNKGSRGVYDRFVARTTRVVRRLDPIARPATSSTELTALLRLAQWHSNMDVAAANLRMFAHCGDLVVLAEDWDESSGAQVVRAMLLDDQQWEASIHKLKVTKGEEGLFGNLGDMVHQTVLKIREFHDHSILRYLDDLANATPGTPEQRAPSGYQTETRALAAYLAPANTAPASATPDDTPI